MTNIFLVISPTKAANDLARELKKKYSFTQLENADVILVLGGDGFMLRTIHQYIDYNIPFYGFHCGTRGFIMNHGNHTNIIEDIKKSKSISCYPLELTTTTQDKKIIKKLAINEITLFRQTRLTTKLQISINNQERLNPLIGDGIIISTPIGSTAYNYSAHGPILPFDSKLLAITPICPYQPRLWRGAIIKENMVIDIKVHNSKQRKSMASADTYEIRNIQDISIKQQKEKKFRLFFNETQFFEERVLNEQFFSH